MLLCIRAIAAPPADTLEPKGASPQGFILIAAHNEAGTIGPTIQALSERLGEWEGMRIWVIADRCTDATAAEAIAAGANVAVRTSGHLGKGAVLAWWLKQYRSKWHDDDCLIIIDADSRLAVGSLSALRQVMANGAQVAQGFVVPYAENCAGRLAGWSEVLMQRIDDEARLRQNWSVPLRGTGMVFQAALLAQLAPCLHTLAEDLELDCLLAARKTNVLFTPKARIIDPKPQQASGASRQRARWLQGQLQVLRDYPKPITQALLHGGSSAWFLLWLLFLRPKILLIAMRFFALVLALCFGTLGQGLALVIATGLLLDAAYYGIGAVFVEDPRQYGRDLLAVPRYGAMWLYGLGLATVRRGWLRAGR